MHHISQNLINKLSYGPSETTEEGLRTTRDNIVKLLGSDYSAFLQGSYKNDTAISNINDIDIVAIRTASIPSNWSWENIFDDVVSKISVNSTYRSYLSKGNKCVKLTLNTKSIDIVPAIVASTANSISKEPTLIFNRSTKQQIANYPKTHYLNGSKKNQETDQKYKKVVRLIKNFANNHDLKGIAPSFYLECLIYSYDNPSFKKEIITSFLDIIYHICFKENFNFKFTSVAGDKIIISDKEWKIDNFNQFKNFLGNHYNYLYNAINASNTRDATLNFNKFFNI